MSQGGIPHGTLAVVPSCTKYFFFGGGGGGGGGGGAVRPNQPDMLVCFTVVVTTNLKLGKKTLSQGIPNAHNPPQAS